MRKQQSVEMWCWASPSCSSKQSHAVSAALQSWRITTDYNWKLQRSLNMELWACFEFGSPSKDSWRAEEESGCQVWRWQPAIFSPMSAPLTCLDCSSYHADNTLEPQSAAKIRASDSREHLWPLQNTVQLQNHCSGALQRDLSADSFQIGWLDTRNVVSQRVDTNPGL